MQLTGREIRGGECLLRKEMLFICDILSFKGSLASYQVESWAVQLINQLE